MSEIYFKLREVFQGHKMFNTYEVREGQEAFCFWDGVTRYIQSGRGGHPKLTFVCQACINDQNPDVQKLTLDFQFHSTIYRLGAGIYPCGCSKQRGKTLLQHFGVDDLIGVSKNYESNTLTIKECLGGKGNKRKYIMECNVCSLDTELYPYGSLTTTKSNFTTRSSPNCGCNPNKTHLKEWQHKVKVERVCDEKGLVFMGWAGEFLGTYTRIRMLCKFHGISDNTRIDKLYLREGGCEPCSQESGNYGYYKGREKEDDFLYLLVTKGDESFCKVGRSFKPQTRIYQHENLSKYEFDVISIVSGKHEDIFNLETKLLKDTFGFKYHPKNAWSGGLTECRTTDILNHPEIISTFNLKPLDN